MTSKTAQCFLETCLPAAVSKHEEQHTEYDAGHADVNSDHYTPQRTLTVSAVTLFLFA